MRRITRAAGAALATALLAIPLAMQSQSAVAANNVQILEPADGATVSGTAVKIHASVSFPNERLNAWKVEVARTVPSGSTPTWNTLPGAACSNPNVTSGSAADINCLWDSTKVNNTAAFNDTYLVKVTATHTPAFGSASDTFAQINSVVANPAATPSGLALTFNDGTQKLTVSWNANTEPDITKYLLNETINSKLTTWSLTPSQAHCTSTACNWSRQITTYGTYSYTVAAVRNAPGTQSGSVQSQPSSSKSATFADPNPTTTTTQPPAGGSGGTTGTTTGGSGGSTGSTGGSSSSRTGESATVSGFRVVQIAGGGPGNVSSSGSASGRVIGGGGGGLVGEGEEPDTGFQEKLPYKTGQKSDDQPQNIAQAIANIPSRVITDEAARKTAMSITAVGLLLFVFAMQVRYITRRAAQA